jgi:hypothetical protein
VTQPHPVQGVLHRAVAQYSPHQVADGPGGAVERGGLLDTQHWAAQAGAVSETHDSGITGRAGVQTREQVRQLTAGAATQPTGPVATGPVVVYPPTASRNGDGLPGSGAGDPDEMSTDSHQHPVPLRGPVPSVAGAVGRDPCRAEVRIEGGLDDGRLRVRFGP